MISNTAQNNNNPISLGQNPGVVLPNVAPPTPPSANQMSTDLYPTMTNQANPTPPPPPASPIFKGGVLVDEKPAGPPPGPTNVNPTSPKPNSTNLNGVAPIKPTKNKILSPVVIIALAVLGLIIIGGSIYYLTTYRQNEINALKASNDALTTQVAAANRRVEQAEIDAEASSDEPLFADANGVFSFYQKFSGMTVDGEGSLASGTYGTTNDGFVFTTQSGSLGGVDLATFVANQMATPPIGATAYDEREEMLGTYPGFSYVIQENNKETIVYFFTKDTSSTNYFKFEYTLSGVDEASLTRSEEMVMRLLNSVKLY